MLETVRIGAPETRVSGGAGLTVRMKINLPVAFIYCYGTLLVFLSYSDGFAGDKMPMCVKLRFCVILFTVLATGRPPGGRSWSQWDATGTALDSELFRRMSALVSSTYLTEGTAFSSFLMSKYSGVLY